MDKMEQLWNYMQEDIKADKIDTEIRRSPLRQKLEKLKPKTAAHERSSRPVPVR